MPLRLLSSAFALAAVLMSSAAHAQLAPLPPTPSVQLAVDPISNRVYSANKDAGTVTALDAATGSRTSITVGNSPDFIAVDPTRDRVYVNTTRDASLTVISGTANTVIAPYPIGSMGPIAINPDPTAIRNLVYVVRMTSAASDEVTFFSPATPTWYTIATDSFQPGALAVNPATHTIFVTHYATGDLRIINGEFDGNDFPHPPTLGMWSKPFAVVANPVTNKAYVITEDSRGPIGVIDGATQTAVFPTVTAGHAVGPRAIAVNPVNNRIYAAFANEVIVIDGGTNALTYIPISGAGSGAISLGVNYKTNRIYVATEQGTLSVIDGATKTVESTQAIAAGTTGIGVNTITNTVYLYAGGNITAIPGAAGTATTVPITTTITHLPDEKSGPSGSISLQAASHFSPTALPVRKVYYRLDDTSGAWTEAPPTGTGSYTAAFSSLSPGSHTLYAFAVDDQVAPLSTGPQSNPLVGEVASYVFTVTGVAATPSLSLASSSNPSRVGDAVTFTASIAGSAGTPTGTISFVDGASNVCATVALASGTATCTTSALASGSHAISARYSGDSNYATASASITQVVKGSATLSLTSSANPSTSGQSVTFTLAASGSAGTPSGSVTFKDGTTTLCTVTLASGSAVCAASSLTAGTHSVRADYAGDTNYVASSSNTVSQLVKAAATVTLSASANPSIEGQAVTFTSTVTGAAGAASGTVSFTDNGAPLSGCTTLALSSGNATCNAPSLTTGSHAIAAQYSGDGAYGSASASLTQTVNARGAPSLTLVSSSNPSNAGQSVTFTLAASGGSGPPTGAVTFKDGSNTLCSTTLASGSASCTSAALTAGTHAIHADYAGDPHYNPGSSNTVNQVVKASATLTLASSANPSTPGQSVTFTAKLSGNIGPVTGTVTFLDGGSTIAGCNAMTIASGSATCTTAALSSGTHAITARYAGDANYAAGTSASLSQGVSVPAKANASVTVSASANPSVAGDEVIFTASIGGASGTPTGSVSFSSDGSAIAGCTSIAVSAGSAACSTTDLSPGTHQVVAQYSGDATYNAAASASLQQSVNTRPKQAPTVTLTTSANPANAGDTIQLVASISGAAGLATGTIDFVVDNGVLAGCGALPMSNASAACATSSLSAGSHSVFARYSGDGSYDPATSPVLTQTVSAPSNTIGELVVRYRLYSPETLEHLYTTEPIEYAYLSNQIDPACCGWTPEGPAYRVFRQGGSYAGVDSAPYYRLYNPFSRQHHWTLDRFEYDYLGSVGWVREGIDGYILPSAAPGAVPLYRLYINAAGGLHLWTTDSNEVAALTRNGWTYEGVSGYVIPLE